MKKKGVLKNNNWEILKEIPFQSYTHPLHHRVILPRTTHLKPSSLKKMIKRYHISIFWLRKLIKNKNLSSISTSFFQLIKIIGLIYFKIFNRIEIKGLKNIPKNGAIFYSNHPGSLDVLLLQIAAGKPISCFVDFDHIYFTKILEDNLYFINKNRYYNCIEKDDNRFPPTRELLVELMVRTMLIKNKYFAIWPEGGLSKTPLVMKGFSSIVRAYAVLNVKKNIVPLVPVNIQGSECYNIFKNPHLKPKTQKIKITFLKPFYIPREWLYSEHDKKEMKTPRKIIDWMMLKIANAQGQKKLAPNPYLDWAKKRYSKSN